MHRAPGEDEGLEQAVAGETIRSVDTGVSDLAAGVETWDGGGAVEIGAHTADHVMRGGSNGNRVVGDVEAVLCAGRGNGGKAHRGPSAERRAVEVHAPFSTAPELVPDRAGDHIAP